MSENTHSNPNGPESLAEELKRQGDRLRELADQLQARARTQAEMEANYAFFKGVVYAWLREKAERELSPLPDTDLETFAKEQSGQHLEDFIGSF